MNLVLTRKNKLLLFKLLYFFVFKIPVNNTKKKQLLGYLLDKRKKYFPPTKRLFSKVLIEKHILLWVNVSEFEGGNIYFGLGYENFEVSILKKILKKGDVFIDVGANIGVYSLLASKLVGKKGKVYAFEPAPEVYDLLIKNKNQNEASNIYTLRCALSDKNCQKKLLINQESGLTSFGNTKRGKFIKKEKVKVITLDKFVRDNNIKKIDLIKIDVEGFEGHVLKGSKKFLSQSPNTIIFCELSPKNYHPLKFSISSILKDMKRRNYYIWIIDSESEKLRELKDYESSKKYQNFLFCKNKKIINRFKNRLS